MSGDPDRELWIVVVGWDHFQHRDAWRGRTPTWIKTYTELHSNDDYLNLSGHRRAILHGLWVEYALSRGQLRLDTKSLGRRLQLVVKKTDLEALYHAGFITFSASKPASDHASEPASLDKRREEKEVKGPKQQPKPATPPAPVAQKSAELICPECRLELPTPARVAEHRYNVHLIEPEAGEEGDP